MKIVQLDHLVLTVKDIPASINFYTQVLGMRLIEFDDNRKALKFGSQKINLHTANNEFKPHAQHPTCGSADLCFIVDTPVSELISKLEDSEVAIESGPVERTGANQTLMSVYIRDPDNNLIELSNLL